MIMIPLNIMPLILPIFAFQQFPLYSPIKIKIMLNNFIKKWWLLLSKVCTCVQSKLLVPNFNYLNTSANRTPSI